jgi:3-hydroxymyristoyl/3-hydroxydecanoyl-(acyl carrier protein) dehydratase
MTESYQPEIAPLSQTQDQREYRVGVSSNLVFFKGHFPKQPVLPGVVQIKWVIELAKDFGFEKYKNLKMEKLKFMQLILPDDELILTLNRLSGNNGVSFAYKSGSNLCSSGRIVYDSL